MSKKQIVTIFGNVLYKDAPLSEVGILSLFEDGENELIDVLLKCTGHFSIKIETAEHVIIVTDRVLSHPIFYNVKTREMITKLGAEHFLLNYTQDQILEYLTIGYVTGADTIIKDLISCEAGSITRFLKREKCLTSTCYTNQNTIVARRNLTYSDFLSETLEAIKSLIQYADGRQIVIPLSAGYDSRLIATCIELLKYKNTLYFTYGAIDHPEVVGARKIANSLQVNVTEIVYTAEKWNKLWNSGTLNDYILNTHNAVSLPHIQDFLAVWELKQSGALAKDCVFVPGHTGDFISGSHLPEFIFTENYVSVDEVVASLLEKHVAVNALKLERNAKQDFTLRIQEKIKKQIYALGASATHMKTDKMRDILQIWETNERQAKYICRSTITYKYFGFDYYLPLWDYRIITLFNNANRKYLFKSIWYRIAVNKLHKDVAKKNYHSIPNSLFVKFSIFVWPLICFGGFKLITLLTNFSANRAKKRSETVDLKKCVHFLLSYDDTADQHINHSIPPLSIFAKHVIKVLYENRK